ncbi:phosphotransferase [Paenibacillus spiritus]|uniref:Phosphotransferase n=1 Tax=Paenibacillus spiritus TaxID=2496557 RepID=A0A5J5G8R9_9BACL|nr:phosphotransferase [Paenibacillus spiritus]KAA9004107.1 phosphotransferase [Paenibacillus spiritus]
MESHTKSRIGFDLQAALVESSLGRDKGLLLKSKELTGGYFNSAYEVTLTGGSALILKISPMDGIATMSYERDIMRAEVAALRLMAETGTVPVPRVLAYDDSRRLLPADYFIMERIDGTPYNDLKESLTAKERAAIEREAGRLNRAINEIGGEQFGLFGGQGPTGSWREAFAWMIGLVLEDADRLGGSLPMPVEEVRRAIEERLPLLDAVTEPRLVHWDLWDGNIFVKDGRIAALIDWERALWGDPLMEYYFRYLENSPAFFEGYGSFCNSPDELRRRKLYDFYLDLIYYVECFSRKYESREHLEWAMDTIKNGWERFLQS